MVCFLKNYQALTNEKDIHLKIKAIGGKLCYLDLSIMLSVFVFLQKHVKKEFFLKKKEEEEEERYWKYLNLDKHQCKTGSTKYKLACPRLDIN